MASILVYHSIGEDGSFITIRADELEKQLAHLDDKRRNGFSIMTVSQLYERLAKKEPSNLNQVVVVTFDDAYENFYTLAWPLLQKYKIPATVFAPTGLLGKTWTVSDGTKLNIMTAAMLKEIAGDDLGLVEFQPHTRMHADLSAIPHAKYSQEIDGSRDELTRLIGSANTYSILAYPFGRVKEETVQYLREHGWAGGMTMNPGRVTAQGDPFLLPRYFVGPKTTFEQFTSFCL